MSNRIAVSLLGWNSYAGAAAFASSIKSGG
jgi:hypothetical protein